MESPEISKEELMKIGWDHCKKLEKVINANNKVTVHKEILEVENIRPISFISINR